MSSPTPQSAKNIRILKREVVDRDTHRVDVAPNRIEGASEAPPGTTTEEDYAKVRFSETIRNIHLGTRTHFR